MKDCMENEEEIKEQNKELARLKKNNIKCCRHCMGIKCCQYCHICRDIGDCRNCRN